MPTLLSPPAKGNGEAWRMELEKVNQLVNRSIREAATAEANPFHPRGRGLDGVHRNGNRNDSSNGSSNNNGLLFTFDCDPT